MKFFYFIFLFLSLWVSGQPFSSAKVHTKEDTLKGSNTEYRNWWNVRQYLLTIEPDFASRSVKGTNHIIFDVEQVSVIQIDLQAPMQIDEIFTRDSVSIPYKKQENFYFLDLQGLFKNNSKNNEIIINFNGKPIIAKNAPWDGGWIFSQDKNKNPWMTVACEGIGASVWFPCKDYLADEPEDGVQLTVITPEELKGIGNGRMEDSVIKRENGINKRLYTWKVVNPINNYNIIPYVGDYVNFQDTYEGEKGELTLDYWVLSYNMEKARKQFEQVKEMLKALEYWFGPYPFYEDGYKLVESPHLGMEHQSAIAYGNQYKNGYLGTDRSGTGVGLNWDFIIVHESGHEWFGNSITNADVADMWIHEAFTTYSETLFTEYYYGKEAANEYIFGQRNNIQNDIPVIGVYGVDRSGSSDMYDKGANMIHTIRQVINDDEKFRGILRGLCRDFYHQTVTSRQIEEYISRKSGIDFSTVFDQYLRTVRIPVFEYYIKDNKLFYHWDNVVSGFNMKIKTYLGELNPTEHWQQVRTGKNFIRTDFHVDRSYYVEVKEI